jgi:glyoxylase-like metal-dependent hydrolase (beta-lactamase superfamily II)
MTDLDTTRIAPGIHRIETIADDKLHGYHVLDGPTGPVLVDTGFVDAPTTVYEPFLESRGEALADVDLVLITHADADHFGGNHELRDHSPGATIACHAADAPWVESVDRIVSERYRGFEGDHGIAYEDAVYDWLTSMMGPDEPVDLRLRGGESIRVGDRSVEVLHAPGHTPGHCMLWDGAHDVLIGGDGFFGRGLDDVNGDPIQPPPYHRYPAYEHTIRPASALDPDVCSFTHYEPLRGDDFDAFVEESLDFVAEMEAVALAIVDDHGPVTLRGAIDAVVDRRGSFGLDDDLAYPLTAHYADLADRGVVERVERDGVVAWDRA